LERRKERQMRRFERFLMMVVGVGAMGTYAATAAADCETDADCGDGYVCTTYEYEMPDCDMPDCDVDDPECAAIVEKEREYCEGAGETVVGSYCERAACETDADCGESMVCIEYVERWCEGSGSGYCDDEGCYTIEEEEVCGEDIHHECGYPYEGECEVDDDCGEGFSCVPMEACWCTDYDSGGDIKTDEAGASGDIVIDTDPSDEPVCGCEPTGDNYCQLQEILCESDADCPAGLECVANGSDVGEDCIVYDDGTVECRTPTIEPAEVSAVCMPMGWYEDDIDIGGDGRENDVEGGTDADTDVDVDVDDVAPDDDDTIFDDINIGIFFGGCTVSAPAAEGKGFGLVDLLTLI
jgi:hypothetical protein